MQICRSLRVEFIASGDTISFYNYETLKRAIMCLE